MLRQAHLAVTTQSHGLFKGALAKRREVSEDGRRRGTRGEILLLRAVG